MRMPFDEQDLVGESAPLLQESDEARRSHVVNDDSVGGEGGGETELFHSPGEVRVLAARVTECLVEAAGASDGVAIVEDVAGRVTPIFSRDFHRARKSFA